MTFTSISDALNGAAIAAGTAASRVPYGAASYAYSVGAEAAAGSAFLATSAAGAAAADITAGRQATSNAVTEWISNHLFSNQRAPYTETELAKKATDLRHATLELKDVEGLPLLCQKIDVLIATLRSQKKKKIDKLALDLEGQKAILEKTILEKEQKAGQNLQAGQDLQKAVQATEAVQNSNTIKLLFEKVQSVHHLCLSIIQNELPKEVQACLLEIKDEVDRGYNFQCQKITASIEKLRRFYSGFLFDLPFPGGVVTKLRPKGPFFNPRPKVLNTGEPSKPTKSLGQFFLDWKCKDIEKRQNRQKELLGCLLGNENSLSDFYKKNLIPSILAIRFKSFQLDDKLALANSALEKGADSAALQEFWKTPEVIRNLFFPKVRSDLLEMACLHGWEMRSDKGLTLLKIIQRQLPHMLGAVVHMNLRLQKLFQMAIDFGGDLLDVMDRETIDKILQSIAQGPRKQSRDSDHGMAVTLHQIKEKMPEVDYTQDGYILPTGVYKWQFELIQRRKLRIYKEAKQRINSLYKQQVDETISRESDSSAGAAASAAGAAANVRAFGGYRWPRELSQLVVGYLDLSKEIALEVQKKRKALEKTLQADKPQRQ